MMKLERHQAEWNQTKVDFDHPRCVQALFEKQVERTPEQFALESADARITYSELNAAANLLANRLRAKGVQPNSLVAIDTGRSVDFVIALLGILKSGAAYVPLDDEYPRDRLELILEDSGAAMVVGNSGGRASFGTCERIGVERPAPAPHLQRNPDPVNHQEDLAYVIYTSGSTGRPKGVCMPHRPLLNLLAWQNSQSGVEPGQRTLQFAALGFDVCFQEVLATLSTGGTLVMLSKEQRRDFVGLARFLRDKQIHRLFIPYVGLECLAEAVADTGEAPMTLREVITAGEQLRITSAIKELFQRLNRARLINQYGPTETHVVSSYELTGDPSSWKFWPPIGRPIANTRLYVLDSERRPVAPGVLGELFIGGSAVARGYLNRPELTLERFIPDPFSEVPDDRLYKTGDSARFLADGNIEFVGRLDDQVKVRGFRVELGEIEAVLASHPEVRECVVHVFETTAQVKSLVAYLVPRQAGMDTSTLRDYAKQRLPEHMVPSAFVTLDAFPVSPNGKVDRRALPRPQAGSMAGRNPVAPRNPVETTLAKLWKEVLGRDDLGVQDDFFDCGGHSLFATRLISRINREFGVQLQVAKIFEHPTIERLAAAMGNGSDSSEQGALIPVQTGQANPAVYFVWQNARWELLRFTGDFAERQPLFLTEAPYSADLLLAAARRDETAYPSIEELAAPHVALIRSRESTNPCVVAGFSYGVVLAFEVACQLERLGTPVAAVLLWDGDIKPVGWEWFKQWLKRQSGDLAHEGWSCIWNKLKQRARRDLPGQDPLVQPDPILPSLDSLRSASFEERWPYIDRIWVRALRDYEPRPLDTKAVLFRAQGNASYYSPEQDYDGHLGWKRFFKKGIEVVPIPGDHFSMWHEANIPGVRQAFREVLPRLAGHVAAGLHLWMAHLLVLAEHSNLALASPAFSVIG